MMMMLFSVFTHNYGNTRVLYEMLCIDTPYDIYLVLVKVKSSKPKLRSFLY